MAIKRPGNSQGLSPSALLAKRRRDKSAAMSTWGKFKKRTAQKENCPTGYDFDHDSGRCIKKKSNRKKNSRSGATKNKYGY